MKCIVSGATGFIGRHLCQQLLARGDTVIALSRSGQPLADGTPTQALDLSVTLPPPALFHGVEVVYHLAGIAHQQAPTHAYRELNEVATLQLARAAAAGGVRCFVFLSSVKAMGPPSGLSPRAEGEGREPADAYGRSKWAAEQALRHEFASSPMAIAIVRPALVYGTGAKGNLDLLARAVRAGLPRPPPLGGRSLVSLADLVDLLCLLGRDASPGVHTWIVTDGRDYTSRSLYDALRRAAGMRVPAAWLPTALWRLGAAVLDLRAPAGAESTFEKLFGTDRYSNRAVVEATGWQPRLGFDDVAPAIMTGSERGR